MEVDITVNYQTPEDEIHIPFNEVPYGLLQAQ